ncbi:MAG TPA: malate synthase G [Novosphingobium sp.]|nr:malate synthase G [Novosphingobium sp.]
MDGLVDRAGLRVDEALARFVESDVLAPLGRDVAGFWAGFARLVGEFAPRNRALLAVRDDLQMQIDAWHVARAGLSHNPAAYRAFLEQIGYIAPEPEAFSVTTSNVDAEIATMAGPQLVVPVLNARFLLNAANARWGSLYDALYGTDALDAPAAVPGGYDAVRGAAVIARAKAFLDQAAPLANGSWAEWEGPTADAPRPPLANPEQLIALRGDGHRGAILLRHNGLHIEVVIDATHRIGATDKGAIADIILESALTTIVDLEDSVAAVDAEDKLAAYRNWLGVIRGDLADTFEKNGQRMTRKLAADREWTALDGSALSLSGRSLLFVRNVGHLMTNPAILLPDGGEIPEGIMDAVITSAIGAQDVAGLGVHRNSRTGSIYIVKPKMHGPDEAAFTNDLFNAVEDLLALPRNTIKVGVMDEERRTSANLAACIHAVRERVVFINTGFLDRTGDEIHTSMRAGPVIRKNAIKGSAWIAAYEARNVGIGLGCGLSGRAQIGKGMWAAPDKMRDMLAQKIGHPRAGANTAWVPSPTAATLHATHYHECDVFARQAEIAQEPVPGLEPLLTIPLADGTNFSPEEIAEELDNNAQGLLGYVVRWIDQGVGCSKVPDLNDVGLMEDRATLRISSQHMANWLLHGVCSREQVMAALHRMAAKVDAQNAADPAYEPMAGRWETSMAFQAACDLVFSGVDQPSGYTEPLLHAWRRKKKAAQARAALSMVE